MCRSLVEDQERPSVTLQRPSRFGAPVFSRINQKASGASNDLYALVGLLPRATRLGGRARYGRSEAGSRRERNSRRRAKDLPRWLTRSFSSRGTSPNVRPNGG